MSIDLAPAPLTPGCGSTPALAPTTATHRRPGWLDRRCRSLLLARLGGLRGGSVRLTDADGTHQRREALEEPSDRIGDALAAELRVHDPALYRRVVLGGGLGAAESYLRGEWTTPDLVALLRVFARDVAAGEVVADTIGGRASRPFRWIARQLHRLRRNDRRGSKRNIAAHYDLGNEFFQLWLDPSMTYSAALYPTADTSLADAQTHKLERACAQLELTADDHLLEIGTGWGSMAIHAAATRGCRVTTTTISAAQHAWATRRVAEAGLADRVTVLLRDYRELDGTYDKLVSLEMIEAVGHQFFGAFLRTCAARLAPHGAALIQLIGMPERRFGGHKRSADFIQHYVFPGSCLPALGALLGQLDRTDLVASRLDELTPHYARTLADWRRAFLARLDDVRALGYDLRFVRLWHYYLAYCEAAFAERAITSQQLLLVKPRSRVGLTLPADSAAIPAPPATPPAASCERTPDREHAPEREHATPQVA